MQTRSASLLDSKQTWRPAIHCMLSLLAWSAITMAQAADTRTHPVANSDMNEAEAAVMPQVGPHSTEHLLYWNQVAIDASGLDHTPVAPGDKRVFGEQLGPHRSSRAMAIVHIAMFDAANAIMREYQPFSHYMYAPRKALIDAAIAQAAHDTLVALYPSQAAAFDARLASDLANMQVRLPEQKTEGIAIGKRAASAILAMRNNDGATLHGEPLLGIDYLPGNRAGEWSQDPVSRLPKAIGAYWGTDVKPFAIHSATQFRIAPPPALGSTAYTAAYKEVIALGGDGIVTPTSRTEEQTRIGLFWAYDGTPSLCAPPRLYNQVTTQVALQQGVYNVLELARLLALVNVAMADAGLSSWESKYYYRFWRPVTGVRGSPFDDGNPDTAPDVNFSPLGAPASNGSGPNFTPPFPAYPSGHATFGGAVFQTLRNFFGTDDIAFTVTSDEYNGTTRDIHGNLRPLWVRQFKNFSEAEEENGQSRIYLGIHWSFDKTAGIDQGRKVANYIYNHTFRRMQDD